MPVRQKRFNIGATAVRVDPTMPGRMVPQGALLIRNRSDNPLYVGGPDVTVDTGYQLDPGDGVTGDIRIGDAVYVIAGSEGNRLDVLQYGGQG